MSIAEKLVGQSIHWTPTVVSLLLASLMAFLAKFYIMGWFVLYVILGLPIFEVISVVTTKRTLSQNLIIWPSTSVRDLILFFAWMVAMISTMALLSYKPFNASIACMVVAGSLLFWRKQFWMGVYTVYILGGLLAFNFYQNGHLADGLLIWEDATGLQSLYYVVWLISMISSMAFLGFHTWRAVKQEVV